jgi:hypothetical protein
MLKKEGNVMYEGNGRCLIEERGIRPKSKKGEKNIELMRMRKKEWRGEMEGCRCKE